VPVARLALGAHLASGDVQGDQQGGSAVADVVVGHSLHPAQPHRQQGLGSIESLHLGFLVHAEHHRLVRWVQVEVDDVADLLDKEWVC